MITSERTTKSSRSWLSVGISGLTSRETSHWLLWLISHNCNFFTTLIPFFFEVDNRSQREKVSFANSSERLNVRSLKNHLTITCTSNIWSDWRFSLSWHGHSTKLCSTLENMLSMHASLLKVRWLEIFRADPWAVGNVKMDQIFVNTEHQVYINNFNNILWNFSWHVTTFLKSTAF